MVERKADLSPVHEISLEFPILRSIVGRRQAHGQLKRNRPAHVRLSRLDLLGNGEQGEDEKPLILRLVPPTGDAFVHQRIVFSAVPKNLVPKGWHSTLPQAGGEGLALGMGGLNLLVAVIDRYEHNNFLLFALCLSFTALMRIIATRKEGGSL